jgi:DNA repair exonuclease SbcCD ATPase subunit
VIGNRIAKYLDEGGSFREGVDLLEQAGGTVRPYRKILAGGFISTEEEEALNEALRPFSEHTYDVRTLGNKEPDAVLEVRARVRALKKKESYLHAQMTIKAEEPESESREKELHELAETIMDLEAELDAEWDQIRAYEEKGTTPVAGVQRIQQETVEKMKHWNNLRSRLYKLRPKVKKAKSEAERIKLMEDQQQLEQELATLEEELRL